MYNWRTVKYSVIICICCLRLSTCSVNLAFKKPALLSSNYTGSDGMIYFTADQAVDENTSDVFGTPEVPAGTCTHTRQTTNSKPVYWQVDLGQLSIVTRVKIAYRNDRSDRMNGYTITFSNETLANGIVCYQDTFAGKPLTNDQHNCTVIGRYARYDNNIGFAEICNFEAYGCPVSLYGTNCAMSCPANCLSSTCNPDDGYCIGGCRPGWQGNTCQQVCDDDTYGLGCSNNCFCRGSACDKMTGVCPVGGCLRGYSGIYCNETCTGNLFGFDCLSVCNCAGSDCFPDNGTCFSGSCLPGWSLDSCSQPCPPNMFGQNCNNSCGNCDRGRTCNPVTGICDNGCADGWLGKYCNISCDPGYHGFNCSKECGNCYNGTICNHRNGHCPGQCDPGWHGNTCRALTSDSAGSSTVTAVIVILLLLCLATGLIVIYIKRRKIATRQSFKYSKSFVDSRGDNDDQSRNSNAQNTNEAIYYNTSQTIVPEEKHNDLQNNIAFTPDEVIYSNDEGEDICTNTKIEVDEMAEVIKNKNKQIFTEEYNQLPAGHQFPHEDGKHPSNKTKNRFLATFPYDKNRVILPAIKGVENSDYINASYIDGLDKEKSYIASQGPKKSTVSDFWRMIWKGKIEKIVMVTNLVEGAKTKCEKYWPDTDDHLTHGPLCVKNNKETKYAAFTIRELTISNKKSEKERTIHQYHFTRWPDHGTPDPSQLVHFNSRVQLRNTNSGPLLVHCSAGIGRTGTFIGLHELTIHGRKTGCLDVFQYAKLMRQGRINMIQTPEQYIFLHEALLEALTYPETTYFREDFSEIRQALFSCDSPMNQTKLWNQYEHLKAKKPVYDDNCYTDALSEKNECKNRNKEIIAHNRYRTYLNTYAPPRTDYINAITVPSYRDLTGYITTQIPLPDTVEDFWSMIYDHDCGCVIVLDKIPNDVTFTPPENEFMRLKSFVVYSEREFPRSENITDFDVVLSPQGSSKENDRKIKMFISTREQHDVIPDNTELFVSLCECVIDFETTNTQDFPVVLVCRDGASRCGIFAAMTITIQRILVDKDLDIFHAIKTIQQRQPRFVDSFEQYKFIHELVDDYMDSNQLYVNI
ncbi:receptor-type tyrosine-protein phosphatase epsilon-like [Mytilus californianus]|uniref:receptor-type tyrosine-protein phosphatase epsilon-like n=1 Tax=Mytilus californianus TaxID=6549 RepID=UPI002247190D|nr:receptor-type tyrosine-protein phosphatase epsilon-like [Mytilus californianus]